MNAIGLIVKGLTTPEQRVKLKKRRRHLMDFFIRKRKLTIENMRQMLVEEMGLVSGDRILVSSSFGNLNADFSPRQLIELLQEIVTEEGVIMMPYYPPTNSTIWAKEGRTFDMGHTKSGMGILTNVFAGMSGVVMSCHPTKAVCVWGKDAAYYAEGHQHSTTPYYWDSPYGKLLKAGSKSLCLGLKNIPMFHAVEDVLSPVGEYYEKEKYNLEVIDKEGLKRSVATFVHDEDIMNQCMAPGDYVASLQLATYKKQKCGYKYIVVVDNQEVLDASRLAFADGRTRIGGGKNKTEVVLVLGLTAQGLSLVRTLGKRGIEVVACYSHTRQVGSYSKYGTKKFFANIGELKEMIGEEMAQREVRLLCYITSGELLAAVLREFPELYRWCEVVSGPYEAIERLAHKDLMYEIATGKGFRVAKYRTLDKYEEGTLDYPLFIKRNYEIPLFFKAATIPNQKVFLEYYRKIRPEDRKDVMVQEKIVIPQKQLMEISAQAFYSKGIAKGFLIGWQKRKLKKGLTSCLEEVEDETLTKTIRSHCSSFMQGLKYTGFAEFEFMFDTETNGLYFLEVNTRTCGEQSAMSHKFKNLCDAVVNPFNAPVLETANCRLRWMNIQRDVRARVEKRDIRDLSDIFASEYDILDVNDMKPFFKQFVR